MEVKPLEVRNYETKSGKVPFEDWLKPQKDIKTKAIIRSRITRLRTGNMGDCNNVGHGVFELRIDHGPGYRVYFGYEKETIVILLLGGSKRRQDADIAKAQEYLIDHKRIGS